jgi:hypothetical protein
MRRPPLTLAFLILLVSAAANRDARADQAPCPLILRIVSIMGADTNEGIDTKLTPIVNQLDSMFHYSTYRLVGSQEGRTCGSRAAIFSLPGGRVLHIEPHGIEGGMIAMQLTLFQGERLMISANVQLSNQGVLMLGGPRYREGMLITSIQAASPKLASTSQVVAAPPNSPGPAPTRILHPGRQEPSMGRVRSS